MIITFSALIFPLAACGAEVGDNNLDDSNGAISFPESSFLLERTAFPLKADPAMESNGLDNAPHILEVFGKRARNFGNQVHLGTDYRNAQADGLHSHSTAGNTVRSVGNGQVMYANYFPYPSSLFGVVVVSHTLNDGSERCSAYGHLENVTVEKGDTVYAGSPLGTVMNWEERTTYNGSSHLHMGVLNDALCKHSRRRVEDGGYPAFPTHHGSIEEDVNAYSLDAPFINPSLQMINPDLFIRERLAQ